MGSLCQPPSRLWGPKPSSGPREITSGEVSSQGIQKSETAFPPRTPIKAGGHIPSAHPATLTSFRVKN